MMPRQLHIGLSETIRWCGAGSGDEHKGEGVTWAATDCALKEPSCRDSPAREEEGGGGWGGWSEGREGGEPH